MYRSPERASSAAASERAAELLTASHGAHVARRGSIAACRLHTDLTCTAIAPIHHIASAQPSCSRATVARSRADAPEFDRRCQQLLDHAEQTRRTAGFANASLNHATSEGPPDISFQTTCHIRN